MNDIKSFLENLAAKQYGGGKALIVYLLSQGKTMQEMTDICLDYTTYNWKLS